MQRELRRRGHGTRESGAFVLGTRGEDGIDRAKTVAFYNDLDPRCLDNGFIEFHSIGYDRLWERCREHKYHVLADIHTHPGNSSQSEVDRTHPMLPESGYVAAIIPNYAQGFALQLSGVSVYEYQGNYRWKNWTGTSRRNRFRLTIW